MNVVALLPRVVSDSHPFDDVSHPTLRSRAEADYPALANQDVHLFSDLALHNMGPGLADDIVQGRAAGDEFRTAPLWGVGSRAFFLHDGRTTTALIAALEIVVTVLPRRTP